MESLTKRQFLEVTFASASALVAASATAFAASPRPEQTLFRNVRVFDGHGDRLSGPVNVLTQGELIKDISSNSEAEPSTRVIEGGGRTLMPGLIDAHVHLQWNQPPYAFMTSRPDYIAALALREAEATLMRGFTSVRDTGGNILGLVRALDEGRFPGPRVQCARSAIGMTGGHGDYRNRLTSPRAFGGPAESELERLGIVAIADGVDEVLTASREQFRQGANFLKLFVGGAVTGLYDPIDVAEYSPDEVRAAAGEAARWNTYLAVHAYTDESVRVALESGAKSIEHANLLSKKTVELLVKKDAWLSAQTGVFLEDLPAGFSDAQRARQAQAREGLGRLMKLAKRTGAKVAFGCDLVGSAAVKTAQSKELVARTRWFTNAEVLRQATSGNGDLFALTGPRNPYPAGSLGVVKKDAYADLLLVDGDPLNDISILANPEKNIRVIMKGGQTHKNTLG